MENGKEIIFWETLKDLPEHKREFDEDVFQAILNAMEKYKEEALQEHEVKISQEVRVIPTWKLKEIEDTLRLVSNTLNSPKRITCLDRCVMRSWNYAYDAYYLKEPTREEQLGYYMKVGQTPHV